MWLRHAFNQTVVYCIFFVFPLYCAGYIVFCELQGAGLERLLLYFMVLYGTILNTFALGCTSAIYLITPCYKLYILLR